MKRSLHFLLYLCAFLSTFFVFASDGLELTNKSKNKGLSSNYTIDSLDVYPTNTNEFVAVKPIRTFRNFKSLEQFDIPVVKKKAAKLSRKEGFQFNTIDSLKNKKWLEMANTTFAKIEEVQNYIDLLSEENLGELPVAIRPKRIGNVKYIIGIAKAVFKPLYTELTVFLKIETPRGVLILGASDIKLSHEGGIIGEGRLNLISRFTFNINNGTALITLNGSFEEPGTYALMDCSGFKELGIDANLKLSNGLIYPVDEDGKEKLGYVEGNFKTVASDWSDIIANISLPEFGIKGLKGTTFKLNTAIFDFSDLRNDPEMPQHYLNRFYNDNASLWQGVYIKTLKVVLPKAFRKRNSDTRISFGASNLVIDGRGITGKFEGNNILSLNEGSASKWKFSLDNFVLDIETNSLKEGKFDGQFLLPISKEAPLKYQAIIQPDEYSFRVTSTNEIDFDVWNAKATLTKDSYIHMKVKDDKFRPEANLNGRVNIISGLGDSGSSKKTVDFKGIVFENMLLKTESPKFSVDYFGYKSKMKLANFPVTINEIGLESRTESQANLIFDFNINLTSENDGGNGGGAKLAIKGKLEEDNQLDTWKFDGVELERLYVEMDVSGMQLKGSIFIFEDDPTYGTGFAGAVGAKFTVGVNLDVEAKALFGRTENFRYWFADANVTLPTGIPVFTAFSINSFGGGFYNRMKMTGVTRMKDAAFTQIGASTSGVIYEPYEQNGFGMKASVGLITTGSEELFHGSLEFGISFLRSGGLQEIYFKGEGEMITSLPGDFYEKLAEKLEVIAADGDSVLPSYRPEGAIAANMMIRFDFENDVFHATSELYINLGILEGIGPNGRAGWLDFYVGPDKWHLLIGTPSDPVGVAMDIGVLKERTESYFMAGDDIPGSPPPPHIVADLLGVDIAELDYMRDLNKLKSGKGLAFGSRWSMTTGDLRFLIFYARFDAGIGFDIMLKDYGEARCKGKTEQIGMNGWYANGQAYAYLYGKLGLKFKIFGKRKKITIFSGGGAVLMQARLQNPTWLKGYLTGKYNLLGGLVKGRFRFKVELGSKCEIVGANAFEGIVVIGDMSPKDKATNIDVFAAPQVSFNLQINKVFELPEDTGDVKYRIFMDKFELTQDGKQILGKVEWNNNNDVATFYSHEILPPNSNLKAFVQLHFEEFINGKWEVIKDGGKPVLDTKEITFETGVAPESIPMSNIAYMYPTLGQKNFYVEEYDKGYINLKRGQSYLFDAVPSWDKTVTMTDNIDKKIIQKFTYNPANKQIVFILPKEIATQTDYNLEITLVPDDQDSNITMSESYQEENLGNEDSGNSIEIRSRTLDDVAIKGEERELLAYEFSTSQFRTFERKMNSISKLNDLYQHVTYPYGLTLIKSIDPIEPFDLIELVGSKFSGNTPLIVARAIPEDSYYKKQIYPLLYQNYPLEGKITVSRPTVKVGVPPIEGVEPMSWYLTYLENDYTTDINKYNPYRYNLAHYYHQDYEDIRYQLVNSNLPWEAMNQYQSLIFDPFPLMRKGKYKTKFQYVLPGQEINGGVDIVKYTNPIYE